MLFAVKFLGKASSNYFLNNKNHGVANAFIEEMIDGQKEVKVYQQQDEVNEGLII